MPENFDRSFRDDRRRRDCPPCRPCPPCRCDRDRHDHRGDRRDDHRENRRDDIWPRR